MADIGTKRVPVVPPEVEKQTNEANTRGGTAEMQPSAEDVFEDATAVEKFLRSTYLEAKEVDAQSISPSVDDPTGCSSSDDPIGCYCRQGCLSICWKGHDTDPQSSIEYCLTCVCCQIEDTDEIEHYHLPRQPLMEKNSTKEPVLAARQTEDTKQHESTEEFLETVEYVAMTKTSSIPEGGARKLEVPSATDASEQHLETPPAGEVGTTDLDAEESMQMIQMQLTEVLLLVQEQACGKAVEIILLDVLSALSPVTQDLPDHLREAIEDEIKDMRRTVTGHLEDQVVVELSDDVKQKRIKLLEGVLQQLEQSQRSSSKTVDARDVKAILEKLKEGRQDYQQLLEGGHISDGLRGRVRRADKQESSSQCLPPDVREMLQQLKQRAARKSEELRPMKQDVAAMESEHPWMETQLRAITGTRCVMRQPQTQLQGDVEVEDKSPINSSSSSCLISEDVRKILYGLRERAAREDLKEVEGLHSMEDDHLKDHVQDLQRRARVKSVEMEELKSAVQQLQAKLVQTTEVPEDLAETLQRRCRDKDRMIAALANELRLHARSHVWGELLTRVAADDLETPPDFDACALAAYLQRPSPFAPQSRAKAPSQLPAAPANLRVQARTGHDSVILVWSRPSDPNVCGYEIYVNGTLRHRVRSPSRTLEQLEGLNLCTQNRITVCSVNPDGVPSETVSMLYPC
ncbi:restin homolog [Periplaneta americana]|uniref:restin homolog n=1 Tax=Periplaneta americana TaxID=6978 RepID=UPI0037E7FF9E